MKCHGSEGSLMILVVKQEGMSPGPVAHWPNTPAASWSPPTAEPGCTSHCRSRALGASQSPANEKSKFPPTRRSLASPLLRGQSEKQELEDHPWRGQRGREDHHHKEPSEQKQRRACRNSEQDQHRDHCAKGGALTRGLTVVRVRTKTAESAGSGRREGLS